MALAAEGSLARVDPIWGGEVDRLGAVEAHVEAAAK